MSMHFDALTLTAVAAAWIQTPTFQAELQQFGHIFQLPAARF
jgi:hypothetical protein